MRKRAPSWAREEVRRLYDYAVRLLKEGLTNEAKEVSRLAVFLAMKQRMGYHAYRFFCRRCMAPIVLGRTFTVRLKSRPGKTYLLLRCNLCGYVRRKVVKHKGRGG